MVGRFNCLITSVRSQPTVKKEVKNKTANAPITSKEIVMVMIS